jgi:hypothetical protein
MIVFGLSFAELTPDIQIDKSMKKGKNIQVGVLAYNEIVSNKEKE